MVVKYEIEKFDHKNEFNVQGLKMSALLVQHGLFKVLKGKYTLSTILTNDENDDLLKWAHNAIK